MPNDCELILEVGLELWSLTKFQLTIPYIQLVMIGHSMFSFLIL